MKELHFRAGTFSLCLKGSNAGRDVKKREWGLATVWVAAGWVSHNITAHADRV